MLSKLTWLETPALVTALPLAPDGNRLETNQQHPSVKFLEEEHNATYGAVVGVTVIGEIEVEPGVQDKEANSPHK